MTPLGTIGITMPADFPRRGYDDLNLIGNQILAPKANLVPHFAGAVNAIAYRFRTCCEAEIEFSKAVQAQKTFEDLYFVVRGMYAFFVNGLSSVESAYYALYALGAAKRPDVFTLLAAGKERRITVDSTVDAYCDAWPTCSFSEVLCNLSCDAALYEWSTVRNVLSHRVQPGRLIHGVGGGRRPPPAEIRFDGHVLTLEPETTAVRRRWLARRLDELLSEAAKFHAP
jgi:hypothetical protein